jgi:hypothetical protein
MFHTTRPVQAIVFDLGSFGAGDSPSRYQVLLCTCCMQLTEQVYAYDEVLSIDYFGMPLQPYWRHVYQNNTLALLEDALANYTAIRAQCTQFDAELVANLTTAGGDIYATLTSLAYRQVCLLFFSSFQFATGHWSHSCCVEPSQEPCLDVYEGNFKVCDNDSCVF